MQLPIAGVHRYKSIVNRALKKNPPFEGKDKKSDKGFKDALIWESILDFASQHTNAEIIFYSKDNGFDNFLSDEFIKLFPDAHIYICKDQNSVYQRLTEWAKQIDSYSTPLIEEYKENRKLIEWINSEEFLNQLKEFNVFEKSHLIIDYNMSLDSYSDIQINCEDEKNIQYSFDATLNVVYVLNNGSSISDKIDVQIMVDELFNKVFVIDDVYKDDIED